MPPEAGAPRPRGGRGPLAHTRKPVGPVTQASPRGEDAGREASGGTDSPNPPAGVLRPDSGSWGGGWWGPGLQV